MKKHANGFSSHPNRNISGQSPGTTDVFSLLTLAHTFSWSLKTAGDSIFCSNGIGAFGHLLRSFFEWRCSLVLHHFRSSVNFVWSHFCHNWVSALKMAIAKWMVEKDMDIKKEVCMIWPLRWCIYMIEDANLPSFKWKSHTFKMTAIQATWPAFYISYLAYRLAVHSA